MLPFISSWLFIGPHLLSTKTSRIINSMLAVYFIVPEMFFPVWAFIRGISQMGQYSKYFCMIADRMRLELNYLLTYSLKFYNHDPPPLLSKHILKLKCIFISQNRNTIRMSDLHMGQIMGGGLDLDL